MVDSHASRSSGYGTVKTLKLITTELKIVAENVKHLHHLAKDEDSMIVSFQLGQQAIQ
jgi:hypothetical protein